MLTQPKLAPQRERFRFNLSKLWLLLPRSPQAHAPKATCTLCLRSAEQFLTAHHLPAQGCVFTPQHKGSKMSPGHFSWGPAKEGNLLWQLQLLLQLIQATKEAQLAPRNLTGKEQRNISRERFLLLPYPTVGWAERACSQRRAGDAVHSPLALPQAHSRASKMLICETRYLFLSTEGEAAKINEPQNVIQHLNRTVTDQRLSHSSQ